MEAVLGRARIHISHRVNPTDREIACMSSSNEGVNWHMMHLHDLPQELLHEHIMANVSIRARLTCAICVCKAWRGLQLVPSVWRCVRVQTFDIHDSDELDDEVHVDDEGLRWLFTVVDPRYVREFMCVADKSDLSGECVAGILSRFERLDRLVLCTSGVLDHGRLVLMDRAAHHRCTRHLKRVHVESHLAPAHTPLGFLSACANLEQLRIAPNVATPNAFFRLAHIWTAARHAPPALMSLHVSAHYGPFSHVLALRHLHPLGSLFPSLRSLSLKGTLECTASIALTPMTSLRHVSLISHGTSDPDGFERGDGGYETEIGAVFDRIRMMWALRALLQAAPGLLTLRVKLLGQHVNGWRGTMTIPGASLIGLLPRTLERLELTAVPLAFAELDAAALPNLCSIELLDCGPAVEELESRLLAQCPRLTLRGCKIGNNSAHARRRREARVDAAVGNLT